MRPPRDDRVKRPSEYTTSEQTRADGYLRNKWLAANPRVFEPPEAKQPKPFIRMKAA